MLKPSDLETTGLIVAITDRALSGDYREACITELAARVDGPREIEQRIDLTEPAEDVKAVTAT
jgi:hypothetical protein